MKEIEMTKMVEEMDLRNLTPEVDMTDLVIATPDINRPALQLTGYYEHFANERVQIIGYVENAYISTLTPQRICSILKRASASARLKSL